ncbi:MAG: hypothetical protein OXN18_09445 [Gemmatimonadota bacterium]|nr:hypothetical protein [Gemmatimonadota bacterium]
MSITFESVVSLLTPILAVYGAALSTYICIRNIRSERVKIFVTHGWSFAVTGKGPEESPEKLQLCAVNECRQDVVVGSLTLEIPGFCRITPQFLEYEKRPNWLDSITSVVRRPDTTKQESGHDILKPGHQLEVAFDYSRLVEALGNRGTDMPLRVRAVFEDTLENVFFSSWFHIGKDWASRG